MHRFTFRIDIGSGQSEERIVWGKTEVHAWNRLVMARNRRGLATKRVPGAAKVD